MTVLLSTPPDLADRLAAFDSMAGIPGTEIDWLVTAGNSSLRARGDPSSQR
jgi:hypothetical protein